MRGKLIAGGIGALLGALVVWFARPTPPAEVTHETLYQDRWHEAEIRYVSVATITSAKLQLRRHFVADVRVDGSMRIEETETTDSEANARSSSETEVSRAAGGETVSHERLTTVAPPEWLYGAAVMTPLGEIAPGVSVSVQRRIIGSLYFGPTVARDASGRVALGLAATYAR